MRHTNHHLNASLVPRLFAIALLTLGLALGYASNSVAQVTEQNLTEKIAAAKTPADHEAIAAFYRSQAAAAAAKVKSHEAMMASYKTFGKGGVGLADHCKTLIAKYKEAEKDYETMAAEHEALAKAGK
jgi:hypothetical protein